MDQVSSTPEKPAASARRKSGVIVPHKARLRQRFASALVYVLIRLVSVTVRFRLQDESGLMTGKSKEQFIFALWHNRLALSLIMYRRYIARFAPDRRLAAMVSASRDGGFLARILELFGAEPVRGSSSRRGPQALREMVSSAEVGLDLAITPDGPRGPCYQVQEGVISTAQLTGLPIVPVSYYLSWKIRSKSWDRFQIPLPFTRCDIHVGRVIRVPREASDAERAQLREEVEKVLKEITRD